MPKRVIMRASSPTQGILGDGVLLVSQRIHGANDFSHVALVAALGEVVVEYLIRGAGDGGIGIGVEEMVGELLLMHAAIIPRRVAVHAAAQAQDAVRRPVDPPRLDGLFGLAVRASPGHLLRHAIQDAVEPPLHILLPARHTHPAVLIRIPAFFHRVPGELVAAEPVLIAVGADGRIGQLGEHP